MYLTNSIECVASREIARSWLLVHVCTVQSANSSLVLSEGKCRILIYANEAFGRSEMLTISHLAHKLRLSASVQGSCCRLPLGRSAHSPHALHNTQYEH